MSGEQEEYRILLTFHAIVQIEGREDVLASRSFTCFNWEKNRYLDRDYGWQKDKYNVFWRELGNMVWTGVNGGKEFKIKKVWKEEERLHKWEPPDIGDGLEVGRA